MKESFFDNQIVKSHAVVKIFSKDTVFLGCYQYDDCKIRMWYFNKLDETIFEFPNSRWFIKK